MKTLKNRTRKNLKKDTVFIVDEIDVIDVSKYQPKNVPSLTWRECIKKIWKDDPLRMPKNHKKPGFIVIGFHFPIPKHQSWLQITRPKSKLVRFRLRYWEKVHINAWLWRSNFLSSHLSGLLRNNPQYTIKVIQLEFRSPSLEGDEVLWIDRFV